jgi:cell division protein FtsX
MTKLLFFAAVTLALGAMLAWFLVTQAVDRAAERWYSKLHIGYRSVRPAAQDDEIRSSLDGFPKPWYVRWADKRAALASERRARARIR